MATALKEPDVLILAFSLHCIENEVDSLQEVSFRVIVLLLFSHQVMSDSVDPMDCSMPGFPVSHQLLELAQTHVHQVSDAIQPFHPLSSSSPPAFNI